MPAPRLTPARRTDLDELLALERRCFAPADRFPRRVWRHLLGVAARRGSALAVVARGADGRPLGAIAGLMRRGSRVLRIYTIAVDPAARGMGLGRRLVAALCARAPRSCDVLSLEVRTDNAAARALYESLGMRAAARMPSYYADGAEGLRYRGALLRGGSRAAGGRRR